MEIFIPIWVLWLIGGLIALPIIALTVFFAAIGIMFVYSFSGSKSGRFW